MSEENKCFYHNGNHRWRYEKFVMVHIGLIRKRKNRYSCACGALQHRTIKQKAKS